MFTGIVRAIGTVSSRKGRSLVVRAPLPRGKAGDSIAVNGACLTVLPPVKSGRLSFDASAETLRLTNLGTLKTGDAVNLEPALRAADALGGHLMSGHVDGRGKVLLLQPLAEGFARLRVSYPPALKGLIARKGSISIDGVSLTVTKATPSFLETVLVPHTLRETTLSRLRRGSVVNLEADMLARYAKAALESLR